MTVKALTLLGEGEGRLVDADETDPCLVRMWIGEAGPQDDVFFICPPQTSTEKVVRRLIELAFPVAEPAGVADADGTG